MTHGTEQEAFWAGEFGDEYTDRNQGARRIASNLALFSRILERTRGVRSVLELGANIGLNLAALGQLLPEAKLTAVEINEKAAAALKSRLPGVDVRRQSLLDFEGAGTWDLAFTKGVLIHVNPEKLPRAYDVLHRCAARYVLVCEYYNPSPAEISYRGHAGKLFKRDFAGEILERFPGLALVDYGFAWRRDPNHPQDDLTWFLMEKR